MPLKLVQCQHGVGPLKPVSKDMPAEEGGRWLRLGGELAHA
jgi:hypothetical protein